MREGKYAESNADKAKYWAGRAETNAENGVEQIGKGTEK